MKSFRRLFDLIVDQENLWDAWRDARKGKRRTTMAAAFELDAEQQLAQLQRELRGHSYRPRPYRLLYITDPKRRLIAAAPFRDRVVHHAMVRVAHPCYGRSFIHDSFACLPGRGSHRAVLSYLQRLRQHRWVLGLDIVHYFPSISWDRLISLLGQRTTDRHFLALVSTMLESAAELYRGPQAAAFLPASLSPPPRHGLPIGNYTSQWFANLYLDGLDHFVKRQLKVGAYQRYMDDMTLFADHKADLHAWRDEIAGWLERERGLAVHRNRAHPRSSRDHHKYLGYRVSRAGIRPGPRLERRLRDRVPHLLRGEPERLRRSLASYRGAYLL